MSQAGGGVVEHPVLAAAHTSAVLLGKACDGTAWQLGDDGVEAGLEALEQVKAAAAVLEAQLLAEADSRGLMARTKSSTTQGWLAARFRVGHGPAGVRLRQAEGVLRHPALAEALVAGSGNLDQATVVVEVFDDLDRLGLDEPLLADAQAFLLDQTSALGPRDLRRAGQALVEQLTARPSVDGPTDKAAVQAELDAAEHALARAEWNTLTVTRRPGGRLRGRFDLNPLDAALVFPWLKSAGRPLPGADGFQDDRPRDRRLGDALAALLAAATGCTPTQPDQPGPNGQLDVGDRDGLPPSGTDGPSAPTTTRISAVDHALLVPEGPPEVHDQRGSGSEGPGPQVVLRVVEPGIPAPGTAQLVVTIGEPDLKRALREHPGSVGLVGMLDTGGALTPHQLRRLACDAGLIPCLLDGDSQPIDVGRARRTWTDAQRRAVTARDRGCTAPGCDRPPAACHLHHRDEWSKGGNTDIRNAALLCDHHHGQVHRQGWKVVLAPNGYPAFIPPTSIDPEARLRQHHRYRLKTVKIDRE